MPVEQHRGALVEHGEVADDGRQAERRAGEVVVDGARQRDALGPRVAQVAVVGQRRAAAPLFGVLGDRAAVVDGARRADADARLRHEAAERREQRRDAQQRLGVRLDARLEQRAQRLAVGGVTHARVRRAARRSYLGANAAASRTVSGGRVGTNALHRDAVGARELPDDARMARVEPAAESRAARADQERHRGAGSPLRCGARGQPPLGLVAAGHGQRVGRVGGDLAALLRGVRHRDEHAHDRPRRRRTTCRTCRAPAGPRCRGRARARCRTARAGPADAPARRRSRRAARDGPAPTLATSPGRLAPGTRAQRKASIRSGGPSNSPSIAWRYSVPILIGAPMSAAEFTCGTLIS